mmetsp:Transcript_13022/g.37566  ORF Transcript_13022/g.37566 Transcript_13022/m.37566 type:complete len:165 (+) Transcript_13022:2051-2545(+)
MACIRYAQRASLFDQLNAPGEPRRDQARSHARHHGKRPRDAPSSMINGNQRGDETIVMRYIALFAKWVQGLRQAHANCMKIPVALVLKVGIRISHHIFSEKRLEMKTETLAAIFWVALKFYSSRDTIPNASFMSMVAGVTKESLLESERNVLANLGWDLYSSYR